MSNDKFDDPLIDWGITPFVKGLTLEELDAQQITCHEAMGEILDALTGINLQIEEAQSVVYSEGGEYADADWWRRVNAARRIKGRQQQAIQSALSVIGKRLRAARQTTNDAKFITAAKQMLDPEVYASIWQRANI